MRKDYYIFNVSFVLRTIGLGIFTTLFNLYILSTNYFTENFLEVFLSIGNLSMAISSYFVGILIDKYSKRKLMFFFTVVCSFCMLLEIIETNEILMYIISVLYGVGATGLFTLTPPILKSYENDKRKNLIIFNRALNVISATVGAMIAGVLTGKLVGLSEAVVLLGTPVLYLMSALIYLLHSENKIEEKLICINVPKQNKKEQYSFPLKFLTITVLSFVALGFAPMLVNYVNVYFKDRFLLDISETAYTYAIINLMSGVFIIILSRINFENIKIIVFLFISIIAVNVLLIVCNNLIVQIICVFFYICLYEILTSSVYEIVLSKGRVEFHGRLSGIIQMSSNLSETLGIYACGWLLGHKIYGIVFGLSICLTAISAVIVVSLWHEGSE